MLTHKDIPYQVEINPIPAAHVSALAKKYIREELGMNPYKSNIGFGGGTTVWVWNKRRVECFNMAQIAEDYKQRGY